MSTPCIPPNPDTSGIGVRIAIYLQNLLTFAPVVIYLWDRKVTCDEVKATEGQSVGILSIAFALLISTIIEAKASSAGTSITRFHAAVILDLSWMNNTSAFVWFLLYAHNRSKPERDKEIVLATWSAWTQTLLSPLNRLLTGTSGEDGIQLPRIVNCVWDLVSQAPVLTLGSIHLSLMSAIGIWLWSNPSQFGTFIDCDPSLTVVGVAVRFSSPALRIFSLFMYALLLVPGFNLVIPFLFFLSPHIIYNQSQLPKHWSRTQYQHTIAGAIVDREHNLEANIPDDPNHRVPTAPIDHQSNTTLPSHTMFLVIGIICLAAINIIFLVDIEQTLSRNQQFQSHEENDWGFGQVLALLLLVVPFRDLVTSIRDIRQRLREEKESQKLIQKQFKESLWQAIENKSFEGHDFQDLIDRGADQDTELEGNELEFVSLLQLAVHTENEGLVKYLTSRGAHQNIRGGQYVKNLEDHSDKSREWRFGTLFLVAAHGWHMKTAFFFLENRSDLHLREEKWTTIQAMHAQLNHRDMNIRATALECLAILAKHDDFYEEAHTVISDAIKCLDDPNHWVCKVAINCISHLGLQGGFYVEIQRAIPDILKCLNKPSQFVREAVIQCISSLGTYDDFYEDFQPVIPALVDCLYDSDSTVCNAVVNCFLSLEKHGGFHKEIQASIPSILKSLKQKSLFNRQAAIQCISDLGAYNDFHEDIWAIIPDLLEHLEYSGQEVSAAAMECLSRLGAHGYCIGDIQEATKNIIKCLKNQDRIVRKVAIQCCSILGAHNNFCEEIRTAIPDILACLKDSDQNVCQAAIECFQSLGKYGYYQNEIQPAILGIFEHLKTSDKHVRQAVIECFSSLGAHNYFYTAILTVIPVLLEFLNDPYNTVCQEAIKCFSGLGAHSDFHKEICPAIPHMLEYLKTSDKNICQAVLECLSSLGAHTYFHKEILGAIPLVLNFFYHPDDSIRQAAFTCFSTLVEYSDFHKEIRTAIPELLKLLKHPDEHIRQTAIQCFSSLGAHIDFHEEIRAAIPDLVKCLHHSEEYIRQIAVQCFSSLIAHSDFHEEIQPVIGAIFKLLNDSDKKVRQAVINLCHLSLQKVHSVNFHEAISIVIPAILEHLNDSDIDVRQTAVSCLRIISTNAQFDTAMQMAVLVLLDIIWYRSDAYPLETLLSLTYIECNLASRVRYTLLPQV